MQRSTRSFLPFKLLIALGLAVILGLLLASTAVAQTEDTFYATLTGEEANAVTDAYGVSVVEFNAAHTELYFQLNVADLDNITQAHIHLAPPGQDGPPVVWLFPDAPPPTLIPGTFSSVLAEGTVTAADLVGPLAGMTLEDLYDAMVAGNTYVNVHTSQYPNGEIRGQLAEVMWSDLPTDAYLEATYGINSFDLALISVGFTDGTWRPYDNITRFQFTKMAVQAFNIPLAYPATPTFSDVPADNIYFPYVEGAYEAGLVQGTGGGMFGGWSNITRQQAVAIVARWIAEKNCVDLATHHTPAEIATILNAFGDASQVSLELREEMAYAVELGIVQGTAAHELKPLDNLTRIQGAALITRAQAEIPGDIVDVAVAAGDFTILVGALQATGLNLALMADGPFTVFAPTDEAFEALPEGLLESLTPEELTDILLYHVVSGRYLSTDLSDGMTLETLLGLDLTISVNGGVMVNDANVIAADVCARNGVIHVIDEVLLPPEMAETIPEVLATRDEFSILLGALEATGLDDALMAEGPFTLFAPTNEAFEALPEGLVESLTPEQLTDILLYHVVAGLYLSTDLEDDMMLETLLGPDLTVSINGGVMVDGAMVIEPDIMASNGVIHAIDSVLIPPEMMFTIPQVLMGMPEFSILLGLLGDTELDEALMAEGPFTLFAPTNEAFEALPEGTLESLTPEELTDILLYHVVEGQYLSTDLEDGQMLETLLGPDLTVSINGEVMINTATVVEADIIASNGVIHAIDEVLLPPT